MTNEEKIEILDGHLIRNEITPSGEVIGLWKMSTFTGDDCSEWFAFDEIMDILKEANIH